MKHVSHLCNLPSDIWHGDTLLDLAEAETQDLLEPIELPSYACVLNILKIKLVLKYVTKQIKATSNNSISLSKLRILLILHKVNVRCHFKRAD